jgi:hypothetical protein
MKARMNTATEETTAIAAQAGAAQEPSQGAPKAGSTPDDRSTTFQPVEGGAETRSGSSLLIEAYAVLWIILMIWLVTMWRKQGSLNARLEDLERTIDKAAAKKK